jgi:hypothetical protein
MAARKCKRKSHYTRSLMTHILSPLWTQ